MIVSVHEDELWVPTTIFLVRWIEDVSSIKTVDNLAGTLFAVVVLHEASSSNPSIITNDMQVRWFEFQSRCNLVYVVPVIKLEGLNNGTLRAVFRMNEEVSVVCFTVFVSKNDEELHNCSISGNNKTHHIIFRQVMK